MTFLLIDNKNKPTFYSILECKNDANAGTTSIRTYSGTNKLNKLSCVPLVSTGIGIARAFLGIAYTIEHLARAIFKQNRETHLKKALVGLKTLGRGALEIIPIIGNLAIAILLIKKTRRYSLHIDAEYKSKREFFVNHATAFHDDRMIAKMPIDEFRGTVGNGFSTKEKARIISQQGIAV